MEMKRYTIGFKWSKDGRSYSSASMQVKAETQRDAYETVKSKYPYVTNLHVINVR